jgi:N-acetylgalactosamine kinase
MFSAIKLQNELNTESSSNMIKWDVIYGNNLELIRERKSALSQLVENFIEIFSEDRIVYISRAPGRVNLMGRHIDHQGGFINTVAINKEILLAFSPRNDNKIQIHNLESVQFPSHQLSPISILDVSSYSDWKSFTTSVQVKEFNKLNSGDWSLYILAIYYRLQIHFNEIGFKGLDCVVSGNIPVGSGLSSSSALGVAFAKALLHVNKISLTDKHLIELTGESELFVGFHGGKGDQAAIISAKNGMVNKIGFFPFHIDKTTHFPEELKLVIAFSGSSSKKGEGAQSTYNQRVASYAIGLKMLQHGWKLTKSVSHIRDLTPERLHVSSAELLTVISNLPIGPTRKELMDYLNEFDDGFLKKLFLTHDDPGQYDLIGTLLFGISECSRSEFFNEILESYDLEKIGKCIAVSHNGDRLNKSKINLTNFIEYNVPMVDIPGNYDCSTENIDQMVDIANAIPGVIGAQLAGAGMGGNIVVLVKENSAEDVLTELNQKYYTRNNIPFDAHICVPISGASIMGDLA